MEFELRQQLIDLVIAYTTEVNKIERDISSRSPDTDPQILLTEFNHRYRPVFEKYCTSKKRVYGGEKQSFGSPPQYEGVESCYESLVQFLTESKAEVIIKCSSPTMGDTQYLFALIKKMAGWKIDSYKRWSGWRKKWISENL